VLAITIEFKRKKKTVNMYTLINKVQQSHVHRSKTATSIYYKLNIFSIYKINNFFISIIFYYYNI